MTKRNIKNILLLIICAFALTGCGILIKGSKETSVGKEEKIEKNVNENEAEDRPADIEADEIKNEDVREPEDTSSPTQGEEINTDPVATAKAEPTAKPEATKNEKEDGGSQPLDEKKDPVESVNPEETAVPQITTKPSNEESERPEATSLQTKPTKAEPSATAAATAKPAATTRPAATVTPKPATAKPAATATPKPATAKPATKKPAATATPKPSASIPEAKTEADVIKYNKQGIRYKVGNTYVTPCKEEKKAWADSGYKRVLPNQDCEILGHWVTAELRVTGICDNGFVQVRNVTVYPTGKKGSEYVEDTEGVKHSLFYTHKDFIKYEAPIWTKMRGYDPEEVCRRVLLRLKAKGHKIYGDNKEEDLKYAKEMLKEAEGYLDENKMLYKSGQIDKKTFDEYNKDANAQIKEAKDYVKYLENLDYINDSHEVEFDSKHLGHPEFFNQNLNRIPYTWGFFSEDGTENIDDIVNYLCSAYGAGEGKLAGGSCMAGYKKGVSQVEIQWSRVDVPYGEKGSYVENEKRYCFDIGFL